jgi:hypothetical protein
MNNSLKEKIRYWFEFLKISHRSVDSVVQGNLKTEADFYSAWGDYKSVSFNEWWKTHSHLFKDSEVLSVLKDGYVVSSDAFHVRIPYTYAPTTVGKIVSEIYDRELQKRASIKGKMRKVYGGSFRLSQEDYQVAQFYYYLIFVRDVYLPIHSADPKAKTGKYIEKSKEVFGKVKKKTTEKREIPFTNANITYESASRLVRRYKQMAEKLLRNVSSGVFPGDYEETFIKNQSQIRAEKAAKAHQIAPKKRLRGRPVSMDQVIIKREDGFNPYSGQKRSTRSDKGKKRGSYSKG